MDKNQENTPYNRRGVHQLHVLDDHDTSWRFHAGLGDQWRSIGNSSNSHDTLWTCRCSIRRLGMTFFVTGFLLPKVICFFAYTRLLLPTLSSCIPHSKDLDISGTGPATVASTPTTTLVYDRDPRPAFPILNYSCYFRNTSYHLCPCLVRHTFTSSSGILMNLHPICEPCLWFMKKYADEGRLLFRCRLCHVPYPAFYRPDPGPIFPPEPMDQTSRRLCEFVNITTPQPMTPSPMEQYWQQHPPQITQYRMTPYLTAQNSMAPYRIARNPATQYRMTPYPSPQNSMAPYHMAPPNSVAHNLATQYPIAPNSMAQHQVPQNLTTPYPAAPYQPSLYLAYQHGYTHPPTAPYLMAPNSMTPYPVAPNPMSQFSVPQHPMAKNSTTQTLGPQNALTRYPCPRNPMAPSPPTQGPECEETPDPDPDPDV